MSEVLVAPAEVGWQMTTLGELCLSGGGDIQTGPFGSQLHASDYVPTGIPSVMPQNIGDNVIVEDGIARITPADAARLSRYLLREGDIVYSRRGDVERRALVREDQDGWLCGTGCLRVRPGTSADSRFLSYYLGHPEVREWIVRHAIGATMPNLNTSILSALPVTLPPKAAQLAISALLGALDDKIAVNDRIVDKASELAQMRLQPVIAAGSAVSRDLASISTSLSRGVTPRYTDDPSQLMVLNQKCIRDGRVNLQPSRRTQREPVPGLKLLRANDILVNSTGVGTLGRVARWMEDAAATVDSHVTIVRIDPSKADPVCVGFAMLGAQQLIESLGEGSTGQTELSRVRLGALALTIPDDKESRKLRPVLDGLAARGKAALDESRSLAELRDTLLPRLMSGEIRARDAERIVEDAT